MKPWYTIKAAASGDDHVEIDIYGDIGASWWGDSVTAAQFVKDLREVTAANITVRINSYGGSVVDGIAIYNAIKRHSAKVTVSIDGLAASIASLIAMAGDEVEIADNAMIMVHAPWGGAYGNATELRAYADLLDTWAQAMSGSYAAKTGKTKDEILALLTDGEDHWYSAQDALDFGLVDRIVDAVPVTARFDGLNRFVSLPAAAAAFSKERISMSQKQGGQSTQADTNPAPAATTPAVDPAVVEAAAKKAAAEAVAAENARQAGIRAACAPLIAKGYADIQAAQEQFLSDTSMTVAAAKAALLDRIGAQQAPANGGHIVTVADARDKARVGIMAALEHRSGLGAKDDTANQFRGYSLYEMARAVLLACGVSMDGLHDKRRLISAAFTHSTSDFPKILENIANKSMLKGYEEVPETFESWTRKGSLPDFKVNKRVDLGMFPTLLAKPEGAEYKFATVGERGEQIVLGTFGRAFSITRETVINDDLDLLGRLPRMMGRAAKRTVGNLAYGVLTANGAMSDSVALFHADHSNLLTGAAITSSSVDAMRVAMAKQKDPQGLATALGIRLRSLIVPVALEGQAQTVRDSQYLVESTNKNLTLPNYVRGTFEIVSDARLDAVSAAAWYGATDPNMHDTIEIAYLDGNEVPFLDTDEGWHVDGTSIKVRLDVAAKALDFRGLARNPGP